MAKRKKKETVSNTTEHVGRARDLGLVHLVAVEIDSPLYEALEECVASTRHKKRIIVSLALEEYFTKLGLWPRTKPANGGKHKEQP